jgi:hypothetical protein
LSLLGFQSREIELAELALIRSPDGMEGAVVSAAGEPELGGAGGGEGGVGGGGSGVGGGDGGAASFTVTEVLAEALPPEPLQPMV